MSVKGMEQIGRLALRAEGENWNAYYAMPGTMEGAIFLGSIRLALVDNKARKDAFINLMRECVADLIEEKTGKRPTWGGLQDAPEHERSGSA